MATKRVTVSVPVEVATRMKRAAGRKRSVSEWVTSAVVRALEDDDLRRRFLAVCDEVEANPADEQRARYAFAQITRRRGKRAASRRRPRRGRLHVAQVWRGGSGRQSPIAMLLAQVEVVPLDAREGKVVGML